MDVEKFVYEKMGTLTLGRKGIIDIVRAAIARDREERIVKVTKVIVPPDPLSADLVRLAEADKAVTSYADDDCVILWKWCCRYESMAPGLAMIFSHKTSEPEGYHDTPRAAVDAVLKEIDSTKGRHDGK